MRLYPFQIHSIALSSFASIVGPFGGFFASGFKRAFKIKVCVCVCVHYLWYLTPVLLLPVSRRTSLTPSRVTAASWTALTAST